MNRGTHPLPAYSTEQSAGMDLRAWLDQPVTLQPLERAMLHTGIYIALPQGYDDDSPMSRGLFALWVDHVLDPFTSIAVDHNGNLRP